MGTYYYLKSDLDPLTIKHDHPHLSTKQRANCKVKVYFITVIHWPVSGAMKGCLPWWSPCGL